MAVTPDELDRDRMLHVANGTLDLRTGRSRNPSRGSITKLRPRAYDPPRRARPFGFLERIMAGNADVIEFLQRAIGYS